MPSTFACQILCLKFKVQFTKEIKKQIKMTAFSDIEHPWSWLHREEIKVSALFYKDSI